MRPNFFHHLHPPTIPARQARFRHTLGAGGLAVFFALILLLSGALEMFAYLPATEQAAQSIQTLTFLAPYGWFIRNLHFWAAQGLVLVTFIHLIRVILTGAFTQPRRFNYWLGLLLLVLVLFLDFTGYALRWDQGVQWALVAGGNLLNSLPLFGNRLLKSALGGSKLNTQVLIHYYAWHIFGLILVFVIVTIWHLFRVRRDGGIAAPPPNQRAERTRIDRFTLVRREVIAMLLASGALSLISVIFPAPIAAPIGATTFAAEVRAPWFFLWIQYLLRWGSPFWMGIAIPLSLLILLGLFPIFFKEIPAAQTGQWFPPNARGAQIILLCILIAWALLTMLELLS